MSSRGRPSLSAGARPRALAGSLLAIVALAATTAFAADTRFATLTVENDFFAGYDRHYTNGMQLAVLASLDAAPAWLRDASADSHAVVAFGQRIYTPSDTQLETPDRRDRPYGGWLYGMLDVRTRESQAIDHVSITAGVVGRASGARQTQTQVHRILGDERPRGWDTQLRDRPTLMVGYERVWPALAKGRFDGHEIDFSPRVGVTVGSPFTYANMGAIVRYGSALPRDVPAAHISLGPPRDGFRGTPFFGWYGWAGIDVHAAGYNQFVQGSTYAGTSQVSRETFGRDVQAGVVLAWPRARLGFTLVQRSSEFEGQQGSDRYGQLTLSWAY